MISLIQFAKLSMGMPLKFLFSQFYLHYLTLAQNDLHLEFLFKLATILAHEFDSKYSLGIDPIVTIANIAKSIPKFVSIFSLYQSEEINIDLGLFLREQFILQIPSIKDIICNLSHQILSIQVESILVPIIELFQTLPKDLKNYFHQTLKNANNAICIEITNSLFTDFRVESDLLIYLSCVFEVFKLNQKWIQLFPSDISATYNKDFNSFPT